MITVPKAVTLDDSSPAMKGKHSGCIWLRQLRDFQLAVLLNSARRKIKALWPGKPQCIIPGDTYRARA